MANKIQFRRGSDAERGTVKLDSGEPGWTTDTKELYVGDGATYGGILVTGAGGGGAGTLCALSDVSCAGTVDGRALTYQAGTWVSRGTVVVEQIPTLPTSRITTGTFGLARIPSIDDARIPDLETLSYGGAFATAQIPAVGAYKIASGTLAVARHETLDNLNGTVALSQVPTMDDGHIPDVNGLSYGAAFATAQVPAIGAYKLSSGTLGLARIPSIDDVRIPDLDTLSYSAAFADAQIPNLAASKITTGTFNVNRIETLDNLKGTVTADKVAALGANKITTGTFGLARIPAVDDARIPHVNSLSYDGAFATAQIPAVGAYKIASGTLAVARHETLDNLNGTVALSQVPTMDDGHVPDLETLSYGGTFATAQIPNLPTSKITSGTFGLARIPSIDNAHLTGEITSDKIPALSGTAIAYPLNADTVGTTAIKASGVGNAELAASGLDIEKFTVGTAGLARIPTLPTARITTGTFGLARIPSIDDARIPDLETLSYGGAFATAQIPAVGAYKIASGTLAVARHETLDNLNGTVALSQVPTMDDGHIPDVNGLSYGAAFATAQVPAIGAYKTASGTLNADRIPVLPTARYGSAVLVSGTRAMTNAFRLKSNAGTTGMATVDGAIFFDTTADKVKVYVA